MILLGGTIGATMAQTPPKVDTQPKAHRAANAPKQSIATVVYDVKLHEFHCWREDVLTDAARARPCDYNDASLGWHSMTGDLYFVRGEAVSILLVNAVAQDIFGLDVKADDLAEPTVPIAGSLTELPKLLPIPAAPSVIAGAGVTFAATTPTIKPTERVYRLLTIAGDKDFKSWVQSTLIDPLGAKEVTDFGALDVETALGQLSETPRLVDEVTDLQTKVKGIATPTNTVELVDRVRSLVILLGAEGALRNRLTATGVVASGKTVNDALTLLRSTPLRRALEIDSNDFLRFTSDFELAFPPASRYARINVATLKNDAFELSTTYREA